MKVSYVKISLWRPEHDAFVVVAEEGQSVPIVLTLPLTNQNETVGQLQLSTRVGESHFSSADLHLLDSLARQAGAAIQASRLNLDLQNARARLVIAQEEERRRIRRDLHDGLGASLAALNLQAGEVQRLMNSDISKANCSMDDLRANLRMAIGDTRRLVYGLRPPALDELGLLDALRNRIAQYKSIPGDTREALITPIASDKARQEPVQICDKFARVASTPPSSSGGGYLPHRGRSSGEYHKSRPSQKWAGYVSSFDGGICLEIRDDGVGMPEGLPPRHRLEFDA